MYIVSQIAFNMPKKSNRENFGHMGPATIGRSLRSLAFKTFAYSLFCSKIGSDMKADL